jgi:hypothetical protein
VSIEERHGELYVKGLLEESGHSTIRIMFYDENIISSTVLHLHKMGCNYEISDNPKLVSVDIPPTINYSVVKAYLDGGEYAEIWSYEESCIAHDI